MLSLHLHPTTRRKLPLHPNFPFTSPDLFPLLPWIFPTYFLSLALLTCPTPFFSLVCHTHTESHTQSSQSLGLPADLECSGAEGCPVTSCPSTSPLPHSPRIYCKGQVTSDRKMDATITFPFSAAPSPCLFLMEIVGKKNLLLLSKSYQIFIRVIL